MNLASIIESHPDDHVAIISRGEPTTYGQLRDQVAHLRGGLAGLGIEAGDRVAILASNNWYFVVSYLATLGIGAVAVPMNPASPAAEIEREMAAVGVKAIVVGPTGRRAFASCDRTAVPSLEVVVRVEGADIDDAVLLDDLLAAEPAEVVDRTDDDLAVLIFTSGTAGHPKAAMLSHGNLLSNIEQQRANPARQQGPDDVVFGVLPVFHIFGLNVVIGGGFASGSDRKSVV